MEEPTLCLSIVTCQTDPEKGDEYQCQSLRLPRTRPGMLHVMDTHTHHRIYRVTVDYASPPC